MLLTVNESHPMLSRRALLLGSLAAAGLTACNPSDVVDALLGRRSPKLVLVFVDGSGSIAPEDWTIYAETFREAVARLHPGDKIVVGLIGETTMRFLPTVARLLPRTDVLLDDEEVTQRIQAELLARFEPLRHGQRGRRTPLLDTLNLAQQLIESDGERPIRWILLLSDMQEDSAEYRFDTLRLDAARIREIIERRRERHLLPSLQHAQVLVAGATAPSPQQYEAIRQFWMAYLEVSDAVCGPGAYGRGVPRFPSDGAVGRALWPLG